MSGVKLVNQGADVIGKQNALLTNITAARSLQNVIKSNLGPKGTLKMLVSGAGDIKLTKDGKVLLDEMDEITGDGTTSIVLFTGELLRQADRYLQDNVHPRLLVEGFELARERTLKFLDQFKVPVDSKAFDRELLTAVTQTSLRTKLHRELADHLTEVVVNAMQVICRPGQPIDLHMVEIMHMRHQTEFDTRFVNGLVLDHGSRHPKMPSRVENAFILVCNVSLEYEKSEVNATFFYKDASERERLAMAERKFTDDKVRQVIAFKNLVCKDDNKDKAFVVINQKGIDPISLDMLQKENIVALRRAKRRNMERLPLACGGFAVNSLEELDPSCLGFAGLVYEHVLGDDKFTFVEDCKNPTSCTILVRGPTDHSIRQMKDAVHDGLRAVKNVFEDECVIPGAGAFELVAHHHLLQYVKEVQGRAKLGVQAFADALLVIPKTLSENSGFDTTEPILELLEQVMQNRVVGLDVETGKPLIPSKAGIWDNYRVKKQFLHLGSLIAIKLLLVDEIVRAGRKMGSKD